MDHINNLYASAWKSSCDADTFLDAGASHLATTAASSKASWNLYDHSSLFECTRCTQGNCPRFGRALGQGLINTMDGEMMQELQYHMDDEEDMCMGTEMKMMKKRKLTNEQARQLEASFEVDKKLEAEKKQRLATQLGLEPRQVAVWFQNRRARSKTKQLEIDFLALKAEYDRVIAQRRSLQDEIARLAIQLQAKNGNKISSCSQESTSSSNSNNGDIVSESKTLPIKMESSTKEIEGFNYNSCQENARVKEGFLRCQDFTKYSSINNYDWDSYDNGLWVFD